MSKIYGARVKSEFNGITKTRFCWYSHVEAESTASMEKAKLILAPAFTTVDFEPVSDDVIILQPGIYRTDANRFVEIHTVGNLQAHGRFLKQNLKPMVHELCVFYVNGHLITHTKYGNIVEKVVPK